MIGASRRRSAMGRGAAGSTFELHLREARVATVHRRLLHAALLALAAAVVALFLPLSLPWRAGLVLAAGATGAAWPLRRGVDAALKSIRSQTGLSYETALGLLERPAEGAPGHRQVTPEDSTADPADPYGFEGAVMEQARLSIRGFESDPRPAWWLPALVVTVALVVLPEFISTPASSFTQASPTAPSAGSEGAAEAEKLPEPTAPEPPAPGRAEPPGVAPDRDEEEGESPVTDLPEGDVEGQAPLSRYLQSLRERPAATGAPTDGSADPDEGAEADREAAESPRDGTESGQSGPSQPSDADPTDASDDQVSSPGNTEGTEDQSEQAVQEDGTEGEFAAGADEQEGEQGLQPGADQLDQGQTGPGGDDSGADPMDVSRGDGEAGSDAEGADSAGVGGSVDEQDLLDPQGAGGLQEQLPGVLRDGPESVAGSVRLPGSTEVELPPGTSYAPYQNAAEEALTEGDLPLDYQEIIRRYFQ